MTKKVGRDAKFETKELQNFIDLYIENHKHMAKKLVAAQVATYIREKLGLDIQYYHFNRDKEIKEYIKRFNQELTKKLSQTASSQELPVYEGINVKKFLEKNNTSTKLENALNRLESNRKKVHVSYGELQEKHVAALEKNLKFAEQIKALKKENETLKRSHQAEFKKIKVELSKAEKTNKSLRTKLRIYEEFLRKHHYGTMYEYALYLENIISSGVSIENKEMFNVDGYKSNEYDLSKLIQCYNSITTPDYEEDKEDEIQSSVVHFNNDEFDEDDFKDEEFSKFDYSDTIESNYKDSPPENVAKSESKPKAERLKKEVFDDIFD
ncbi:hypothetical protein H7U07_11205 [Bacillus cereus]|uniref:hypothetical protein n=1 Tax=Bacillus cereus TaxID=1396 RepID=UPI001C8D7527|nr:hypothetical protein [Bacillus cereus]MBY0016926.1 hypothetical protein [Bacillus cereus]